MPYLKPVYKEQFCIASVFRRYTVLVQASYDHVLPQPEAKGNQHIYFPCLPVEAALSIFNVRFLFNPSIAESNPICHLLTLLGVHHIFHVSGIRLRVILWKELMNTKENALNVEM